MTENNFNEAPCLYFSSLDDGTLIEINETACKKLGYQKEELIGKKLDQISTIATRIFQQTHFFPLLKMQGGAEEIYITLQTKDGQQVPVLVNAQRKIIEGSAQITYAGIIVRNRKKFEDELVAAKKAAEKALNENTSLLKAKQELQEHAEQLDQQMALTSKQNEELKQFNHAVTHALQEPLRKLFIFTNMLQENGADEAIHRTVEKVRSVSEQMRSLLSGLQQYVWLTENPAKITQVNLDELVLIVTEKLRKENPELTIDISAEDFPCVEANWEQMHFVFQEVLTNAVRFRKPGKKVQIRLSATTLLANRFRKNPEKYKYSEFLKLQIEDDGIGFDATYKDQAFELFTRLHTVSGRGVGLSLCKKIIEHHDGSISIDSTQDKGTTVTILLPLRKDVVAENRNEKQLKTITRHDN